MSLESTITIRPSSLVDNRPFKVTIVHYEEWDEEQLQVSQSRVFLTRSQLTNLRAEITRVLRENK